MPHAMKPQQRESVKRRIAWALLFVVSLGGLIIMTISGIRQRNYVSCNANQVAILIQYQRESSIAAREEREAHDAVRHAQREQNKQKELAAIDQYFVIRKRADERRAKNPLPELPQNVCGKDPSAHK